ncbi:MAG: N-acetylmuramoyl-L-alanine amidase [Rickettsiales bacterium]|nr:N-acetylmuramoyl-L-alanine amidase [Rickettsiales bacterium]|tara:strand:+ start:7398 stop:8117 length:720 start_codon:yes stop_codon:yes gene_type:complete
MLCQLNISHRYKSLNFDLRKKKISFLIFHYTETKDLAKAVKLLTCKKRRVSCHYIVDTNGEVYNLVDEDKRAWHAGTSMWKKSKDMNSRSIGIEIVYPGELSAKSYDTEQIRSVIKLSLFLKKKYKIFDQNILGHSDIAPNRKIDPGIYFPWEFLGKNLVGLWTKNRPDNSKLDKGTLKLFLKNLKKLGYPYLKINNTSNYNKVIIESFHRHHLPNMVKSKPNRTSLNKTIDLLKKTID